MSDLDKLNKYWHGQTPRPAVEPIEIEEDYRDDLQSYHPLINDGWDYSITSEIAQDDIGPYIYLKALGDDWNPLTRDMMQLLKLRLQSEDGVDFLLDDNVDPGVPEADSGWKVIKWSMERDETSKTFVDHITWHRDGVTTITSWPWKQYID